MLKESGPLIDLVNIEISNASWLSALIFIGVSLFIVNLVMKVGEFLLSIAVAIILAALKAGIAWLKSPKDN